MRRGIETGLSSGSGGGAAWLVVKVLSDFYPATFERSDALAPLLMIIVTAAWAIPASWGFSIYGKKSAERNGSAK